MSQGRTVAWLAVRELWMTFRLLLVLFAWVAPGAVVGIVAGSPAATLQRLAIGMAAATVLGAVIAAWTLADERRTGRAGWLMTRSVARGTYLVAWFTALLGASLAGLATSALIGWLVVSGTPAARAAPDMAAATLAVAAAVAAGLALGLLAGAVVRRGPAVAAVVVIAAGSTAATVLAGASSPWVPGGAHLVLARAIGPESVVPDALRAAGIGLALAAILLALARVALERTEL